MIWSLSVLILAVALVNTEGLSIQGEDRVPIHGDEVEQELDVSKVAILQILTKTEVLIFFLG